MKDKEMTMSEFKENYGGSSGPSINFTPIIIAVIIIAAVGAGSYFGFQYYKNYQSEKDKDPLSQVIEEQIHQEPIEKKEMQKLSCEDDFLQNMLPNSLIITRQLGSEGDWLFNPVDNSQNKYKNGETLVPSRSLYYVKTSNNYIAREGMVNSGYFKYTTPYWIVEFNPILVDEGGFEDVQDIKGIPAMIKEFKIKDAQISKCVKV